MVSPNHLKVRAGLKTQDLDNVRLVGRFFKWTRGSSSPYYEQLYWQEVEEIINCDGEPAELLTAEADPNPLFMADLIQRRKKELVVVSAGRTALKEAFTKMGGQIGVAATIGGVPIAGILPKRGKNLGYIGQTERLSAAVRAGGEDFKVGLVFITNKKIVIPEGMRVEQHVPIAGFPRSSQDPKKFH